MTGTLQYDIEFDCTSQELEVLKNKIEQFVRNERDVASIELVDTIVEDSED